ncbi:DUF2283 domain-containing protein [Candidatus Uhrbacteria bacterium]|nr:DUF2283 domain-containing protein [Candidatus Uhrbacteria bacterium]
MQKISYEQEADILRVEILTSPIDYATEIGPFVIHFNKKGIPVYVEILEASKFLKETERAYSKRKTVHIQKMQYV